MTSLARYDIFYQDRLYEPKGGPFGFLVKHLDLIYFYFYMISCIKNVKTSYFSDKLQEKINFLIT